jgi:methyl-accepting chemotaxis protein
MGQDLSIPDDYDPRIRMWYKDAVASNKTIVTTPYVDIATGELVVTIATPVYAEQRKLMGVVAADVIISQRAARIATFNIMGAGYGTLIAPDGTIMQHPDNNYVIKENITSSSSNIPPDLAAIGKKMLGGGARNDWADYTDNDEKHRIFYCAGKTGFAVAAIISYGEIGAIVGRITTVLIVAGIVTMALLTAFMFFLIPTIVRPLRIVEKSLARMAGLDLLTDPDTERFELNVKAGTEVGAMILSLRGLRGSFNEVISNVRESVNTLSSSSGVLDSLSDKANTEILDAKAAVLNIEKHSQEAILEVDSAANAIEEVSRAGATTTQSAMTGAEASLATSKLSSDVSEKVNEFMVELKNIGRVMEKNSEGMASVEASVTSISGFVTTISNIASQTNLLALNAAIEAARAGEAGRGFAVVAEEVRKLAEESNVASKQVADLIETLEAGTSETIKTTKESSKVISKIVAKAESAQKDLDNTVVEIRKVNDAVQSIAAAAEEQAATSSELATSASQVRNNISGLASDISTLGSTAAETATVIESVAQESKNLSEIAAGLANIMDNFTIDETQEQKKLPQGSKR